MLRLAADIYLKKTMLSVQGYGRKSPNMEIKEKSRKLGSSFALTSEEFVCNTIWSFLKCTFKDFFQLNLPQLGSALPCISLENEAKC